MAYRKRSRGRRSFKSRKRAPRRRGHAGKMRMRSPIGSRM